MTRAHLALVALLALTTAVLASSLTGGFVWDDVWLIVHNANIQDPSRLARALTTGFWNVSDRPPDEQTWSYYRPFITLLYAGAWQLFGSDPRGYHGLNVLAHLATVLLARRWLTLRGLSPRATFVATALFALHGSRAESVASISGCTDLWMTLWMLTASLLWRRGGASRIAACGAAALAAFSKEAAFALPVLMATDAWLDVDRSAEPLRTKLRALAPLGATLGAAFVLRAVLVREEALRRVTDDLAGAPLRVMASLGGYTLRALWALPPRVLFRAERYAYGWSAPWTLVGVFVAVGLVALLVRAWRNPALRVWLADVLWIVVPLAPVLNLVPMFQCTFLAQRFLYLPMLGGAALLGRALDRAETTRWRTPARTIALVWVATHAVSLAWASPLWSHETVLWTYAHHDDPADPYACRQLAARYADTDRPRSIALSVRCYRIAHEGGRTHEAQRVALSALSTWLNMLPDRAQADLRRIRGVFDDLLAGRVAHFTLQGVPMLVSPRAAGFGAMARDPWQFRFPHAIALMRTGDLVGAERELRKLVTSHPHFVMGLGNLAVVLGRQSRFDEALGFALRALRQRPGDAYLGRLVATLRAGASLPQVSDARERALVHARVMLDLHAPAEARAALSIFGDEAPPPVVMLRARALVAEGDVTGALAIVTAARDRDPQHRGDWERVLAQLRELANRSQVP